MITFNTRFEIDPTLFSQTQAETILTTQVMKDTRPYVPALTNSLNNRTHIEHGNQIVYPGPYARYLYYGKYMVDSETGRGPVYIKDVGYRYRRGATLVPTDRDLVFTTEVNERAQANWFEASKAQNLEKWKRVLAKAVTNDE